MSSVNRYGYGFVDDGNGVRHLGLIEKSDGALVRYDDFASMEAECERLGSANERLCARIKEMKVQAGELTEKYDDVLLPFLAMMRAELHANAGKGDRLGWLAMDCKTALLEIFYHLGKLQKATKDGDRDGIREYSADVANMSMMLADICGVLPEPQPAPAREE